MENPIIPSKYHQNGGFSMAMLVYRSAYYQTKQCISYRQKKLQISQNDHTFAVFDPPNVGDFMPSKTLCEFRMPSKSAIGQKQHVQNPQFFGAPFDMKWYGIPVLQGGPLPVVNGVGL